MLCIQYCSLFAPISFQETLGILLPESRLGLHRYLLHVGKGIEMLIFGEMCVFEEFFYIHTHHRSSVSYKLKAARQMADNEQLQCALNHGPCVRKDS